MISDDSGLCIKSLKINQVFIQQDLQKKNGGFFKAMKFILKKMKKKKNRSAYFICCLTFKHSNKKITTVTG